GDRLTVDRGHLRGTIVETGVALDAEQHEGRNDQQEQHAHDELGVPANEIEHARDSRCTRWRKNEKGEPGFAFAAIGGGCWWVLTGSNRRPTPCKGAA